MRCLGACNRWIYYLSLWIMNACMWKGLNGAMVLFLMVRFREPSFMASVNYTLCVCQLQVPPYWLPCWWFIFTWQDDRATRGASWKYTTLISRFMGPTWGPSGADRTQVGPMLAPWTLLSGWSLCGKGSAHWVWKICGTTAVTDRWSHHTGVITNFQWNITLHMARLSTAFDPYVKTFLVFYTSLLIFYLCYMQITHKYWWC